jgi:hypothetical protein
MHNHPLNYYQKLNLFPTHAQCGENSTIQRQSYA